MWLLGKMLMLTNLFKEHLLQVGGEHTNYAWMNHICLLPLFFLQTWHFSVTCNCSQQVQVI